MANSTRMTKAMRQAIEYSLYNEASAKRREALNKEAQELAFRVVEHRCGKDWRKRVSKIPENWLTPAERVEVQVGVRHLTLWLFNGKVHLPYFGAYGSRDEAPLDPESELGAAVLSHGNKTYRLRDNTDEVIKQIRATLNSITTVEKLKEVWPEAHAKIPAEMLSAPGKQVAVNSEYLNKLLASFANAE